MKVAANSKFYLEKNSQTTAACKRIISFFLLHMYRCKDDARSACRAGKKQLVSAGLLKKSSMLSASGLVRYYR